jgi:hypothetical protein
MSLGESRGDSLGDNSRSGSYSYLDLGKFFCNPFNPRGTFIVLRSYFFY